MLQVLGNLLYWQMTSLFISVEYFPRGNFVRNLLVQTWGHKDYRHTATKHGGKTMAPKWAGPIRRKGGMHEM